MRRYVRHRNPTHFTSFFCFRNLFRRNLFCRMFLALRTPFASQMVSAKTLSEGNSIVVKAVVQALSLLQQAKKKKQKLNLVHSGNRKGKAARPRARRSVEEIYQCLGPIYFRRAYRMSYDDFWILHKKLHDGIKKALSKAALTSAARKMNDDRHGKGKGNYESKKSCNYRTPPVPNGPIKTSARLACALRYFAGASCYDLVVQYGISLEEVRNSIWYVVEATNRLPEFFIRYPSGKEQQQKIADDFCLASGVGFKNCAGAIDGILVWIQKPSGTEAEAAGIGLKKLFCSRKNKFGLNCQAVSDKRGRFLDISITYGAASSDCLAFEASDLHRRLEMGLLKRGFVIFGDNAYINSAYLATPYPNVSGGSKDNYNFYHSQVSLLATNRSNFQRRL